MAVGVELAIGWRPLGAFGPTVDGACARKRRVGRWWAAHTPTLVPGKAVNADSRPRNGPLPHTRGQGPGECGVMDRIGAASTPSPQPNTGQIAVSGPGRRPRRGASRQPQRHSRRPHGDPMPRACGPLGIRPRRMGRARVIRLRAHPSRRSSPHQTAYAESPIWRRPALSRPRDWVRRRGSDPAQRSRPDPGQAPDEVAARQHQPHPADRLRRAPAP